MKGGSKVTSGSQSRTKKQQVEKSANSNILDVLRQNLPEPIYNALSTELSGLLQESVALQIKEPTPLGPPPQGEITRYQTANLLSLQYLGQFDPSAVTYPQLELMHKNGLIRFVLAIRKMPVVSIFRKPRGISEWRVVCENEKVRNFLEAAFDRVRMRFVRD